MMGIVDFGRSPTIVDNPKNAGWSARGLLFENCNCQLVCPGHVHFDQLCTQERCIGFWAVRFDTGDINGVSLVGQSALIAYDSPQHMIAGNWVQALIIHETASQAQRAAIESILTGAVGGPWAVLARFVGRRLDTRFLPIRIEDHGKTKRVAVDGLLEGNIEAIRGRDRSATVTFENMFNQIHNTSQVIARGTSHYDDGTIIFDTERTHALYSEFHWRG